MSGPNNKSAGKESVVERRYFAEMKIYPLLTREDEQALGKELAGVSSIDTLLNQSTLVFAEDYLRQRAAKKKKLAPDVQHYESTYNNGHQAELTDRVAALIGIYEKNSLALDYIALVGDYLGKPLILPRYGEKLKAAQEAHQSGKNTSMVLSFSPALLEYVKEHPEAKAALAKAYASISARNAFVRDRFIHANLRLVVSSARRYFSYSLPFLDLVQEGNMGLMRAIEKFDYRRGYKFSTYAGWWIRQSIKRFIEESGNHIRIPVYKQEGIRLIGRIKRDFIGKYARKPSQNELVTILAEDFEWSGNKIKEILGLNVLTDVRSLDEPISDDDGAPLISFVPDPSPIVPLSDLEDRLCFDVIEEALATYLTTKEEWVLRMRFGIGECTSHTLEEIGHIYGFTRERIRQIEGQALRKLRKASIHDTKLLSFS